MINAILQVANCIKKYDLIKSNEEIIVAYSGGKDSLFLCYALTNLGYKIIPVIIDIGYNIDWSLAISNLERMNLRCELIDLNYMAHNLKDIYSEVTNYFEKVKIIKNSKGQMQTTICTPCYNAKHLILCELSKKLKVDKVAFGHHGTDAIASMLKSFYLYKDRWIYGNKKFNIDNIYKLVDNSLKNYRDIKIFKNSLYLDIENLIMQGKVSTDEPPLSLTKEGVRFIRPLFYCSEKEVKSSELVTNLNVTQSECSYKFRINSKYTTREYIQQIILNSSLNLSVYKELHSLVQKGLNSDGTSMFDARRNRNFILGFNYKNDGLCQKL